MGLLGSILRSKYFWVIVIAGILVTLTPFLLVLALVWLPSPFNALATIGIFIAWGVVAAYKDWILSKIKESEQGTKGLQGS
ncbi:MAG: hypothetical protein QXL57_02720 [Candidatus Bathyarchaeia archaeon]